MALRKPRAKRLKVSTGEDRESGATSSYIRKLNKQSRNVETLPKTAEERRLEAQLFGIEEGNDEDDSSRTAEGAGPSDWLSSIRSKKLKGKAAQEEEEEDFEEHGEEQDGQMGAVADDQLFFTDAPGLTDSVQPVQSEGSDPEDESSAESDSAEEQEESEEEPTRKASTSKAALWHDPADARFTVSLKDTNRSRKLRLTAEEDVVNGTEYEVRLRNQFRKIHPTPSWATKARQRDATAEDGEEEEDNQSLASVLQKSNAGIARSRLSKAPIPAGELEVTRLRDANQVDKNKSGITALQFHPSSSSSHVLFTVSEDRRLKLYQIDGTHNPLLQSVHVPELPITSAAFHPSGNSILMTGQRPFFYSYDLQAGKVIRSPRGLWSSGLGGNDGKNDKNGGSMELFKFSPDGKIVAVAGRRGYIHLLDWGNGASVMAGGNGGQVLGEIKINTGIKGLNWNANGSELVVTGQDAMIHTWDLGTRKCMSRWQDDGGYGPSCSESDRAEKYFAVGSRSGVVNIYDSPSSFSPNPGSKSPKPLKTIMNLTTEITNLRYNHSSDILAISSSTKKDALKLVHLPTMSVFHNWPTSGTPLGHVGAVDFSRGSEYLALGGHKGRVLLYNLGHYAK